MILDALTLDAVQASAVRIVSENSPEDHTTLSGAVSDSEKTLMLMEALLTIGSLVADYTRASNEYGAKFNDPDVDQEEIMVAENKMDHTRIKLVGRLLLLSANSAMWAQSLEIRH